MTETWLLQIPRICLFLSSVMNASTDQALNCACGGDEPDR